MKGLCVIFVNYNSGNLLLEGVKFALKSPSVGGVIVADNGSKDSSLDMLKKITSKNLIIIKNEGNIGFYKALNKSIKKAFELGADAVMPMDFDLNFDFDFISKLAKVKADIVAPVLKFERNGEWLYDYGGKIHSVFGSQSHILLKRPSGEIGEISTRNREIDYVSGGCTIIRKNVINKIGLFDEDYFVYWGDADYSLRARDNGLNVVMDGKTIVHHKLEFARVTLNFNKLKISFFDNITFIKKRISWYFWPVALTRILSLSVTVISIALINLLKKKVFTGNLLTI